LALRPAGPLPPVGAGRTGVYLDAMRLAAAQRRMSEARAITNLIGNGVATLVVAKWEREFDPEKGAMMLK